LALLQAVAWSATRTGADLRDLRDVKLTELATATLPAAAQEAIAEIFALLPSRTYQWDAKAKAAALGYGKRTEADETCRRMFVLAKDRPEVVPLFAQTAHSWLCRKASDDAHEYKFLAAILEDATWVSPGWRPHLLAASVHYFHGTQTPDNPIIQQVRMALQHKA
jgi:hypothetical protein